MKRRNRGQILVLFTLSLVVLIGMAALGVDVGYMYSVRHDLQRCADAGALAGASRFIPGPGEIGGWSDPGAQAEATARATDYASKDNVIQTRLLSQPGDNVIVTFDQGPDKIKVQTERTVPLFFARLFLGPTKRITAYAVAEAASVSVNTTCLAPFGIPLPWEEHGTDPYKFEKGVDIVTNLADYITVNPDGSTSSRDELTDTSHPCYGHPEVTHWSYPTHDNVSAREYRDRHLCRGSLMALKIGEPGKTQEPGHFLALDYSGLVTPGSCPPGVTPNPGADFYKYMIMNRDCSTGCRVSISQGDPLPQIPVKPGDMVGPTIQAVAPTYYKDPLGFIGTWPETNSLMNGNGATSDYDGGDYNETNADWDFTANTPQEDVTETRHITIPVYDPNVSPAPGKSNIQPVAFIGFWIQDISENQGTIIGRVKSISGPGGVVGPGGAETLKTLRLVE
jgi:hypothetical protein